jgi:stage V sporulation protein B
MCIKKVIGLKRVKVIFVNMVILTGTSLLLRTIGVLFQVYLSNKIGPAGVGLFQLIISIYFLAITLASSGVRLATTRLVAEEMGKGNTSGAKRAVLNCMVYSLAFGFAFALMLFFCAELIGIH